MRIISMLLITLHHFSLWAQGPRADQLLAKGDGFKAFESLIFLPLGDIGVYLFVMITGFYLGNKSIKITDSYKKSIKIYLQMYFYAILFLLLAVQNSWQMNNFPNMIDPLMPFNQVPNVPMSVLPLTFNHYWFVTAFILLMLLLPYINKSIVDRSESEMRNIIIILSIACGVFPLLNNHVASETVGLGIVITSYMIGYYVRTFIQTNTKTRILRSCIGLILFLSSVVIIYGISFYDITVLKYRYIRIYTGIFALLSAAGLFVLFVNLRPIYSRMINRFAMNIFAVYLITENIFVKKQLWKHFIFPQMDDLLMVNVYGFMAVLGIMVSCVLIDKIRLIFIVMVVRIKSAIVEVFDRLYRQTFGKKVD